MTETSLRERLRERAKAAWYQRRASRISRSQEDADLFGKGANAIDELLETLREVLPTNVCLTNRNIPDGFTVALDCTMGDLRKVAAVIEKYDQ